MQVKITVLWQFWVILSPPYPARSSIPWFTHQWWPSNQSTRSSIKINGKWNSPGVPVRSSLFAEILCFFSEQLLFLIPFAVTSTPSHPLFVSSVTRWPIYNYRRLTFLPGLETCQLSASRSSLSRRRSSYLFTAAWESFPVKLTVQFGRTNSIIKYSAN